MLVRDFYQQAQQMFANCDETEIFDRLTDAMRLLANKGISDIQLGEMSICVCNGCVTLPRDVGTVLAIDVCGNPTLLNDQWFKYHINGPGARASGPCGVITEMGQVCTIKDPAEPFYLIAENTSAADNNKKLRVYATDIEGKKIFTAGPNGTLVEGFLVPMIFGYPQRNPDVPAAYRIYRVTREATKDFVKLYAVKASDGDSQTLVGQYEPDETTPTYRRIRVPNKTSVMVKYKKANLRIRSQNDFINLDNDEALRLACRAVKFRLEDKINEARPFEDEAARIWSEQIASQRPAGPRVPMVINQVYEPGGPDGLIYGGNCGYWGG